MACLITTSRNPSPLTRILAHSLVSLLPSSGYQPRGKGSIADLVETARKKGFSRLVFIYERKGNPGRLESLLVREYDWSWDPRIILVSGVIHSKEKIKNMDEGIRASGVLADFISPEIFEDSEFELCAGPEKIGFKQGDKSVGPVIRITGVVKDEGKNKD